MKFKVGDTLVSTQSGYKQEYTVIAITPDEVSVIQWYTGTRWNVARVSNEDLYTVKPKEPLKRRAFVYLHKSKLPTHTSANNGLGQLEVEYSIDPDTMRIIDVKPLRIIKED